jgi:hypothetical protein
MRAGSWSAVWLLESPRIEGDRIGNQALWVGAIQSNKLTFHVILEMVDGCISSLKTPKKTQNNAKVQAQDRIIHHGRQAGRSKGCGKEGLLSSPSQATSFCFLTLN